MTADKDNSGQFPLFELDTTTRPRSAIDPDMPQRKVEDGGYIPVGEIPEVEAVVEPTPTPELSVTEKAGRQLLGLKALLGTFGRMNVSENFRNRFEDSPELVRVRFRPQGLATRERQAASEETAVTLEEVGRSQVSDMLGLKAVVEAKVMNDEQAEAVRNTTYDHYAGQFQGIHNKRARVSQLGKVNRRLKKLKDAQ